MRPKLQLGYKASAEQFGPRQLLDFAIAAEANGFDSVFVSDHFQPWRHSDGHAPFAFAWLAAAGERTSRVALGTSVAYIYSVLVTLGLLGSGNTGMSMDSGYHVYFETAAVIITLIVLGKVMMYP